MFADQKKLRIIVFYTKDYRAEIYTQFGLDWIDRTTMLDILKHHYLELAPSLEGVKNAFAPWRRMF